MVVSTTSDNERDKRKTEKDTFSQDKLLNQ